MAHKGKIYRRFQGGIDLSPNQQQNAPPDRLMSWPSFVPMGPAGSGWGSVAISEPGTRDPGSGVIKWVFNPPPGADPSTFVHVEGTVTPVTNGWELRLRYRPECDGNFGTWSPEVITGTGSFFRSSNSWSAGAANLPTYWFNAAFQIQAYRWVDGDS